ncbi:hypothetical protein L7D48_14100 [Streptomyces sp. S1A]|uniref:hypothetical protein n=1 Tax=Streptomyces sp. ICN903 TaxID=2964654 RepID=UPI001EDA011E|nr:hypothetical protein [Streptomyces sp. ICN903]MCG3041681.1 hypothetical protein [Streptomyces sp. ICN903]
MPTQQTQQTQPTRPYTTARPLAPAGPADAGHRAPAARRPGPPPKVAAPLLVLALVLIAVGVWALTQAP